MHPEPIRWRRWRPRRTGSSRHSRGWNYRALEQLTAIFATGERALHVALEHLDVVEVSVDRAAMRNINTPGDLGEDAASR